MLCIDESGKSFRPMDIFDCIEWLDKPYIAKYTGITVNIDIDTLSSNYLEDIVKYALSDIDRKIELCKNLPIADRERAYKYLVSLCESFKTKICSFLGYDLYYKPDKDDILEEIRKNLQQYIDAGVESGWITYLEEYDVYTDEAALDLNYDEGSRYIRADDTEGLICRYEEYFTESAVESLVEVYKDAHQYAASIEFDINRRCRDIADCISSVQQEIKFIEQAKLFKTENAKIVFSDYLLVPNKDLAISRISSLIRGKKGKNVAIIIRALEEVKFISPVSNNYQAFYNALKTEFGDIGSYEGILKYLQGRPSIARITDAEINKIRVILEEQ